MSNKTVHCVVLKKEADALDFQPYPGELGQRIFESVSREGWASWLERLVIIINENGLNTSDPKSLKVVEENMVGFLFGEGDSGHMPAGFHAEGAAPPAKK